MAKGLQKKKKGAIKQIKARLESLDPTLLDHINNIAKEGKIPATVATVTVDEPGLFALRFDYLDEDTCAYEQIDSTRMQSIIEKFKRITSISSNMLFSSGLVKGSVPRQAPYTSLFNKLSPDVLKLHEISFSGAGRIFCFNLESNFYVVSIETKHRDIYS